MAALRCPKHGPKIALVFCGHAGAAVDERRVVPVFLQRFEGGGWATVCEDCVRRVEREQVLADADYLVCVECAKEWATLAKNDYVQRSQDARPEFPTNVRRAKAPIRFDGLPSGAIAVGRDVLVRLFGEPHGTETEPTRVPGPVSYWGLELENGDAVILEFHEISRFAALYTTCQDVDLVIRALGLNGFAFTKTMTGDHGP